MRVVKPTDTEQPGGRSAIRGWTAALAVVCAGSLWLQFNHIENTLPYPYETDESAITGPATRILQTGTLHPELFIYPSLPTYLTALGMSVGFLHSAARLEINDIQKLGNVAYPYYGTPGVMRAARQLFAVLAIVALAATGAASWHAFRSPPTIVFAPLVLWASPLFFHHSWAYVNVDIAATCFAMLTLAACLQGTRQPSIWQSAVIPGAFAGFATGSKYTLIVLIVPVLLAIGLHWTGTRRLWAALAASATLVAAFLIVVPYSLLAIPTFLQWVAFDAMHYAEGHAGWDGDPGLPQLLFYGRHFVSEFGAIGMAAAVLGMGASFKADWRRAFVLASFPVTLLWLLSSQRVHFPRNVLSLHPIAAMFVVYGMWSIYGWALSGAARHEQGSRLFTHVRLVVILLLVAAAVPLRHVRDHVRDRTDSRKIAQRWIEQRVPSDWTIVVPSQMAFDSRPLKARGAHVTEIDLQSVRDAGAWQRLLSSVQQPAVLLVPHWGADSRYPGQDTADTLNEVSSHLQVVRTFGSNPVLVNYPPPTAWGDPAFAVAVLGPQALVLR